LKKKEKDRIAQKQKIADRKKIEENYKNSLGKRTNWMPRVGWWGDGGAKTQNQNRQEAHKIHQEA